jgi:hypothetical protein
MHMTPPNGSNPLPFARFRIGRISATPAALRVLTHEDILAGLQRHQAGDWGEVDMHDHQANEDGLRDGTRLFSVYRSQTQVKFWIITEADRSRTTVLLPRDY